MLLKYERKDFMTDNALKKAALEKFFGKMNDMQKKAVFQVTGPLLVLAGAGSGKTTVLVNRIADMIYFGNAYETDIPDNAYSEEQRKFLRDYIDGRETSGITLSEIVGINCVNPWNILAITFTNKAANELKARLEGLLAERGEGICAATFHSACLRILRREHDKIGFSSGFVIYDTDDSLRIIKAILKDLNLSDKTFPPRTILNEISKQKEKMISPEEYASDTHGEYKINVVAKIYKMYQKTLKNANAMDFDDILYFTVRLFEENSDVLDHYQNLYKYVMIDEYQDTNHVQYKFAALISSKYKNLCVVGDDDQSIYSFRGANIENILNFEKHFPGARVIRLERNYRSTQNILTCANELIQNNSGRKGKNLWTDTGDGEKVVVYRSADQRSEAAFVADTISENVKNGAAYGDHAVLYRMNAQSNAIEQALTANAIPYKVISGLKFYERKEIKDVVAYLSVIANNADILRLRRIINEPKRKIGEATVAAIEQVSAGLGITPVEAMRQSEYLAPLAKKAPTLLRLAQMFDDLAQMSEFLPLDELLDELLDKSGYRDYMESLGDEGQTRLENINELKTTMANYTENAEEPTLSGFLEEISLYTDADNIDENEDCVVLMTIHAAKGLEYPVVFVTGLEENIFPSIRNTDDPSAIEEERRLAYVAVTRAKQKLYLTYADSRMIFGNTSYNKVSRFVRELPEENTIKQEQKGLGTAVGRGSGTSYNTSAFPGGSAILSGEQSANSGGEKFLPGDRVSHKIFGEGMVVSAKNMAGDTMLEVAFDKVGTKKLMANFARIKKI